MASATRRKLGLGKARRVRGRDDIARLFESGRRVQDRLIALCAVRRAGGPGESRGGVGVSSRHGGAVRRNRLKRLCREAFRRVRPGLPAGWDYFILPKVGADLTVEGLARSIVALAAKVAGEQNGPAGTP